MSNVVAIGQPAHDARQLALIRRTVAADTNDDEFNMFIHMARHLRLDPLRRQIYAFVFSKTDPAKRRMSIIVAIDGFRAIADRTGNYRPDEDEPTLVFAEDAKSPATNPTGLVSATVRVWKRSHGEWHRVTAVAHWDEYAPMKDEAEGGFRWEDTGEVWPDSGKPKKRKVAIGEVSRVLDTSGNWGKMPRLMLAKVAEALALRKAWPDDFANVYAAEEIDRTRASDMLPSDAAVEGSAQERLERIGGAKTILFQFGHNAPLEPVSIGSIADRVMEHIDAIKAEPGAVAAWEMQNRHGLREFWARAGNGDPLAVKQALEAAQKPQIASAS